MASAKRVTAGILFSIALVAMLAFLFLLFVEAENIDSVPGVGMIFEIAIAITIIFAATAIVLLILVMTRKKDDLGDDDEVYFISGADDSSARPVTGQPEEQPHSSAAGLMPPGEGVAPDVVAHDLWNVPAVLRSWNLGDEPVYSFPCAVHHGVYANDYVEIGGGRQLKLRTLLAGPADIGPYVVDHPEPVENTSENDGWDPDTEGAATSSGDDSGAGTGESRSDRPTRPRRSDASSDDFFREMEHRFS